MRFARKIYALLSVAALVLLGCSSEPPAAPAAAPKKAAKTATPGDAGSQAATVRRSEFRLDARLRDPFYPNAKRSSDVAQVASTNEPANAEKLLRDGFQGVFGAGQSRLAIIHNVMLERGRVAVIPIRTGNQRADLTVRVREVLANAVVLEVQGKVITISETNP